MLRTRFVAVALCAPLALGLCGLVRPAHADPIGPGFDLFQTPPGGAFVIVQPAGPNPIPLVGDPIGPGDADTIVERVQGIDPLPHPDGVGTIDIEIVALSLRSIEPVTVGGMDFDLHVDLDPNNPSVGQMTIRHEEANGGTFDSFFAVFVELTLTEVGNPQNTLVFPAVDTLQGAGQPWSHLKPLDYPENLQFPSGGFYPGVDPLNPTPLAGLGNPGLVHTGPHPRTFPATPEPTSVALLALGGVGLIRRRRR